MLITHATTFVDGVSCYDGSRIEGEVQVLIWMILYIPQCVYLK